MCLNEETHLKRLLAQVPAFAEWILLDTGSTDSSAEIGRCAGAVVRSVAWSGFSETRRQHFAMASQPWILWIDADEEVTQELVDELRQLFANGPSHAAYRINRIMFFEGNWIRHGEWYPDRVLRLFRADRWTMPTRAVHESLLVNGTIGSLRAELPHYSYRDWHDRNQRIQKYAQLWATQEATKGRRSSLLEATGRAAWKFFRAYFLKRGLADGLLGLRIARSCSKEVYLKYVALLKIQNNQ
ncbi:MAG: glycosyltransferase family 2 protein [Akkermansiaceae bacterium]|nr:glycosyltransferase family 2 protein [Akkermansiaceae bacterium]